MKQGIIKIVAITLIIGLNWSGILAVGETIAYFNDAETSTNNVYSAGVLDMTIRSGQSNFTSPAENMKKGDSTARDIYVGKTATSLPLQHRVSFEFMSGDMDLCNELELKLWYDHYHCPVSGGYAACRDMRLTYNGKLSALDEYTNTDFIIPHLDDQFDVDPSDGTEQWFYYSIFLPANTPDILQGKVCEFKFIFDGWQDNVANFGDGGFTDTEEIESVIKTGYWESPIVLNSIVLNEFLPNPAGIFGEDDDPMPFGEWVELYNKGTEPVDVGDWYIYDQEFDGIRIADHLCHFINPNTIIGPGEFMIVFRNQDINFELKNIDSDGDGTMDIIGLYDGDIFVGGQYVDGVAYNGEDLGVVTIGPMDIPTVWPTPCFPNIGIPGDEDRTVIPENKSFARIPDGVGNWVDPYPTPGFANTLDTLSAQESFTIISPTPVVEPEPDLPAVLSSEALAEEEASAEAEEEAEEEIETETVEIVEGAEAVGAVDTVETTETTETTEVVESDDIDEFEDAGVQSGGDSGVPDASIIVDDTFIDGTMSMGCDTTVEGEETGGTEITTDETTTEVSTTEETTIEETTIEETTIEEPAEDPVVEEPAIEPEPALPAVALAEAGAEPESTETD